jgi:hypothetical protein
MGQYEQHVFVCTSGETCPEQGDTEKFVKILRERAKQVGRATCASTRPGASRSAGAAR